MLYLQLLKALYECVQSALLWYNLFTNILQEAGFVLNPYNAYVTNKTINKKQCMIVWYVNDNKISHVDHEAVSNTIKIIEKRFGKMTVTRGNEHIFLGMEILFKKGGTVQYRHG